MNVKVKGMKPLLSKIFSARGIRGKEIGELLRSGEQETNGIKSVHIYYSEAIKRNIESFLLPQELIGLIRLAVP